MDVAAALREFAEVPGRFTEVPAGTSVEKFADERVCIVQGATWAAISGVNTTLDGLDDLVAEVRSRVPQDKEPTWYLGPSTRPANAHDELEQRGFRPPRDGHATIYALALTKEPEESEGVDVRRIESFEDYTVARELAWEAFDEPEDRRARNRARIAEDFAEMSRTGVPIEFLACLGGRPAGSAAAIPTERGLFLVGGSTASWARGRGAYRALVRARWEHAVANGTPALVTHAVPETSYPILLRLGFAEVCPIRRLEDPGEVI